MNVRQLTNSSSSSSLGGSGGILHQPLQQQQQSQQQQQQQSQQQQQQQIQQQHHHHHNNNNQQQLQQQIQQQQQQRSPKTPHKIYNKNLDGARESVSPAKQRPSDQRDAGIISPKNVIVEKLHTAIVSGNIEEVKHIIDEGQIKVNSRDSSQNTPLHTAILVGNYEIASYLVAEGVNPSLANEEGNTPLHLACAHSDTSYLDLVISATVTKPNSLQTSVSAPSLPSRQLLMRHHTLHVNTNTNNTTGTSPPSQYGGLSFGSMTSMAAIIPPLATFLNKGNARGNSALHVACFHGNNEAVRILLSKGAEISTNGECWTPIHHAASMGHNLILASLLSRFSSSVNSRDTLGRTPLILAAAGGHIESVKLLAKAGADATLDAESGDTALHLAVRHLSTLQKPNPDLSLLELLLSLNASVTAVTKNGNSPLHIACLYGANSIVDLLLKQNLTSAEINRLNAKLHSPLFLAVMRPAYHHFTPYQGSHEKERLQIIKALLSSGAQIYKRKKPTGKGKCVLHAAAKNGFSEIVHYLTTTVAPSPPTRRPDGPTSPGPPRNNSPNLGHWKNGETHLKIEDALRNIDPAVRDNMGRTPLHYAAMAGSELCVNVFMRTLGAKLSLPLTQDIEGSTPLHLAALYGHSLICEILIRETETPDLIHMTDVQGNTPLHNAALGKSSDTVNALLTRGALVSQTNTKYQTPLHMACMPLPARKLLSYSIKSSWVADSLRMCTSLLEYGAEIQAEDEAGWTALDYALATAQAHVLPPEKLPANDHNFVSPTPQLVSSPSLSQVNSGNNSPTSSGNSPRLTAHHYHATTQNATEEEQPICVAQFLAQQGASTHTRDARMDHALHRAVAGGCVDCVRALLDKGEDVEALGAKDRTPLHVACALGHATLVNILLEHGANVNSVTSAQLTPLHLAARNGSLMSAELLIARGAVVDACCARDWTPLHHACAMGHTEVASLLIDNKADVNSTDITGRTPLHKATYYSHPECVMVLVERGAKANAEDENGETPVHYASIRGLSAALIFMSAVGADHVKPTKKGSTPIHLAARYDHVDTAMFLIEKDAEVLAAVTRKGRSPLHVAARYGKENVTHVLLEHGADCNATDVYGNTPLHMAAKGGSVAVVTILLTPYTHKNGANPNSPNTHGLTPLHAAALCSTPDVLVQLIEGGADINVLDNMGRSPLICALQALNLSCAHKLLELGSSLTATDEDGRTILHVGVLHHALAFVRTLLAPSPPFTFSPISASLRDADDNTPLHTAATVGALEIAQMLVQQVEKAGRDLSDFLEMKNSLGRTALHVAAFNGHTSVITFLLSKGANVEATDIANSTPLHLSTASGHDPSILLQKGANPGAVAHKGLYVIHTAAAGGSLQCVETILDLRPEDIHARTEEGDTPLHVAVRYGHAEIVSSLLSHNTEALDAMNYAGAAPIHLASLHGHATILTMLLDSLANLNLQDHQGRLPLHFAAMSNQKECATILLRRGVQPSPVDVDGRTPLHLAAARGQKMLVGLLLAQPGIEPNALDKEEGTPLAYAQANIHTDCIELLQIHAKPSPEL